MAAEGCKPTFLRTFYSMHGLCVNDVSANLDIAFESFILLNIMFPLPSWRGIFPVPG